MKKVMTALIFVCALFAIIVNVTGLDSNNEFSFLGYFQFVTENIKPFPTISFNGNTLNDIWGLITYIFPLVDCVLHNITVLLYGFFPIFVTNGENTSGPVSWFSGGLFNLFEFINGGN